MTHNIILPVAYIHNCSIIMCSQSLLLISLFWKRRTHVGMKSSVAPVPWNSTLTVPCSGPTTTPLLMRWTAQLVESSVVHKEKGGELYQSCKNTTFSWILVQFLKLNDSTCRTLWLESLLWDYADVQYRGTGNSCIKFMGTQNYALHYRV